MEPARPLALPRIGDAPELNGMAKSTRSEPAWDPRWRDPRAWDPAWGLPVGPLVLSPQQWRAAVFRPEVLEARLALLGGEERYFGRGEGDADALVLNLIPHGEPISMIERARLRPAPRETLALERGASRTLLRAARGRPLDRLELEWRLVLIRGCRPPGSNRERMDALACAHEAAADWALARAEDETVPRANRAAAVLAVAFLGALSHRPRTSPSDPVLGAVGTLHRGRFQRALGLLEPRETRDWAARVFNGAVPALEAEGTLDARLSEIEREPAGDERPVALRLDLSSRVVTVDGTPLAPFKPGPTWDGLERLAKRRRDEPGAKGGFYPHLAGPRAKGRAEETARKGLRDALAKKLEQARLDRGLVDRILSRGESLGLRLLVEPEILGR